MIDHRPDSGTGPETPGDPPRVRPDAMGNVTLLTGMPYVTGMIAEAEEPLSEGETIGLAYYLASVVNGMVAIGLDPFRYRPDLLVAMEAWIAGFKAGRT